MTHDHARLAMLERQRRELRDLALQQARDRDLVDSMGTA